MQSWRREEKEGEGGGEKTQKKRIQNDRNDHWIVKQEDEIVCVFDTCKATQETKLLCRGTKMKDINS